MQKSVRRYRPRARSDLTFRTRDGLFALYDRTGTPTEVLSLAAALVWTCCDGLHDPDAIVAVLSGKIPDIASSEQMQIFVNSLLKRFADGGILV